MKSMDGNEEGELKVPKVVACMAMIAKIVVYILLMFTLTEILGIFLYIFPALKESGILYDVLARTCLAGGALLAAFILLKGWEHRPFAELGLSLKGRAKDILWGLWVALIIYAVGFGILYGLGEVKIVSVHFNLNDLLMSWVLMLMVAVSEEVAFRGFVLGRLLSAGVNRFVALFLSSALFSLMHFLNPDFSLMAFLNILLAGVLMGSTYIYTRNLWFPIALHLFWNWFQGPILGLEVSGEQYGNTLLNLNLPEENLINGGAFGFEGSILCTALISIAIVLTLKSASKQSASGLCPHSVL